MAQDGGVWPQTGRTPPPVCQQYINSISFSTGHRTPHPGAPEREGIHCRPSVAPYIAGVHTEPQVSCSCLHDCQPLHGCRTGHHHLLPGSGRPRCLVTTSLQCVDKHHPAVLQHRYICHRSYRSCKYIYIYIYIYMYIYFMFMVPCIIIYSMK